MPTLDSAGSENRAFGVEYADPAPKFATCTGGIFGITDEQYYELLELGPLTLEVPNPTVVGTFSVMFGSKSYREVFFTD